MRDADVLDEADHCPAASFRFMDEMAAWEPPFEPEPRFPVLALLVSVVGVVVVLLGVGAVLAAGNWLVRRAGWL